MSTPDLPGTSRERLGRNVRWLALMQVILVVVRFLPLAYVARKLGPVGMAHYGVGLIWLEVLSDLHGLAMEDFIPRNVARRPETASRTLTGSLIVMALLAPVIAVISLVLSLAYGNSLGLSFLAIFLAVLFRTPSRCLLAFPVAEENLRPFSIWQSAERIGVALGSVAVLAVGGGVNEIFWFLPALYLALGPPVWVYAIRRYGMGGIDRAEVRALVAQGGRFTGLRAVSLLYGRIDALLVERLVDPVTAGYYVGARRLIDVLKSPPILVSRGLYPVLSRKVEEGADAVRRVLLRFEKMMAVYALPLAVGGGLLADRVLGLLFGVEFEPAGPILAGLVWALALGSFRRPITTYLTAAHRESRATLLLGIGVVVNAGLTLILVPRVGIMGAVAAVVVNEALTLLLTTRELRRDGVSPPLAGFLRGPALASVIMGIVLWVARPLPIVPLIGLAAVVYAVALLLLGGLDAEERTWIRTTLRLGSR